MKWLVIAAFSFYSSLNYAQVTKIIVWDSLYNNPTPIVMNYLRRALEVTVEEYGDYQLIESAKMEQGRSLVELGRQKHAKLDLATYAPTAEREKQAIAIRIPLLSGLMGYRLCLIDEKKQTIFQDIENKQQLINKHISIGQHQDWPDTTILRFNNLPVQTTHKKELLFQKLIRGRFDCFSRGASEIYAEYLAHKSQGIVIEKELLIYYPLPIFFFVNKSRPRLAERIQLGLQKLIDSGEFDQSFEQFFSPIIDELKLTDRVVIDLHNPTLSEKTIQAMKIPTQRFRENHLQKQAD
ncbi:transporter substrate-binding domain-containing protein [Psychromonas ossibalaenae]|uniref:transporter substrate-binding domain-containing protein n=1 Tax=Psychromonas ossibalaenae TaxID=444922 RepID=UPI000381B6A6|nr:transporter substrate-binding domain-containing protein [Psychromonas ossibalaenae]